ncbi:unnamed protein product [Amoebophrya sp. A120]|nr:unnamed protein product [Amoebophrya sp. A120]|eukprot:GSA120T00024978001.1
MRLFFKTAGTGSVPLFCLLVHLYSHWRFSAFQRSCLSATSISFVIGARRVIRRETKDADTSGSPARDDRGPIYSGTNNSSSASTTTAQDPQQATPSAASETPDKNATALHSTRERHTEIAAGRGVDLATVANTSSSPLTPQALHEGNVTGDAVKLVDSPGSLLPRNFSTGESLFLADGDVDYVQPPQEDSQSTAAKGPGPLVAEVRGEEWGEQDQLAAPNASQTRAGEGGGNAPSVFTSGRHVIRREDRDDDNEPRRPMSPSTADSLPAGAEGFEDTDATAKTTTTPIADDAQRPQHEEHSRDAFPAKKQEPPDASASGRRQESFAVKQPPRSPQPHTESGGKLIVAVERQLPGARGKSHRPSAAQVDLAPPTERTHDLRLLHGHSVDHGENSPEEGADEDDAAGTSEDDHGEENSQDDFEVAVHWLQKHRTGSENCIFVYIQTCSA